MVAACRGPPSFISNAERLCNAYPNQRSEIKENISQTRGSRSLLICLNSCDCCISSNNRSQPCRKVPAGLSVKLQSRTAHSRLVLLAVYRDSLRFCVSIGDRSDQFLLGLGKDLRISWMRRLSTWISRKSLRLYLETAASYR